ncbi:histidine phosphatase family protein [Rhodopseudomonas palustris]|uniref:histidine phosphatase family protein n=1 Tax=Rhodopseudomonas palustris TaxID=1076 RepID=UPI0021F2D759|nr:histidine phosphatase family protein [Rhodopseudomonas palustris]UYO54587.1 histidine phosphatase family protein [Rhodopseudomonas palustris]
MINPSLLRRRLFLVRHGESEANLDKTVNARLPDTQISLSPHGFEQAYAAGQALASHLSPDRRIRIFTSPYLRARQTAQKLEEALTDHGFTYDKREAIEIREISFGLFDGIPDEDLHVTFPLEYAHYEKHKAFEGEFFAPMPLGESRCQVADRVKGIFGTILRDSSPTRPAPVRDFVIVSHGVTIRCFRMQWLHYPWEWYEHEPNPRNCSIQLIEGESGYGESQIFAGFVSRRSSTQERREDGTIG